MVTGSNIIFANILDILSLITLPVNSDTRKMKYSNIIYWPEQLEYSGTLSSSLLNHIVLYQKAGVVITFLEAAYSYSNPVYDQLKTLVLFHINCYKISPFLTYCILPFVLANLKYPFYWLNYYTMMRASKQND